jgi:two-component system clock-associated histidine kinase SasA
MQQPEVPLKLLLFIDKRPSVADQIRQIRQHLNQLSGDVPLSLEIVDVSEQPYLAEHFKLVATPALVKISGQGHQTLAGSNLIALINHWWPRWQAEVQSQQVEPVGRSNLGSVTQATEILRLSDDIFKLKQLNAELEAQLTFKNHIIAMLAHDLRNPLTAASLAVETLEIAHDPDQNRRNQLKPALTLQLLKNAKTQIRVIDRMITDILQTARGPCDELALQPQELDLKRLCLTILETMTPKIRNRKLTVTTDIPQDLPHVYGDPTQIQRVLVNLLDNAIKYTPAAGRIDVFALHRTTQKVQVSIHDTGPGIPEENQQRIFEERFRLQRDHSQDGYGLGLALCQRIVQAHYGQIWVDSMAGKGSSFHFTLPVYRGQRSNAASADKPPEPPILEPSD